MAERLPPGQPQDSTVVAPKAGVYGHSEDGHAP
jgi:hypothetical protein